MPDSAAGLITNKEVKQMKYSYRTKGTCSQQIDLEINDDVITNVKFYGGCDGNLKAIPILVDGLTVNQNAPASSAVSKIRHVPTSFPKRSSQHRQSVPPNDQRHSSPCTVITRVFETIHT